MPITDEPSLSKGSMVVTPEKFLNLSESLERKSDVSKFPDDSDLNNVPEAVAPPGFITSLGCSHRRRDETRSCPIVEPFEGNARKLTSFSSTKTKHVVGEIHITSLADV
jgi:hypothetical protein